jgi:DNA-binding SARP family transcriptional activator
MFSPEPDAESSAARPPCRHLSVSRTNSDGFQRVLASRPVIELRLFGPPRIDGLDPDRAEAVLRQPKRLAVLARLALTGANGFERRDNLLAMFWPEQSETRGRHALRQMLHSLRTAFGRPVIARRGDDELAVDSAELSCDASRFVGLLDSNRLADALELYRGDLLPGFHLDGAPEFDRWLDETRSQLRRRAADAAARLTTQCETAGDLGGAASWARRAHELAPDDEAVLRRLLGALDRAGNRAAALQVYEKFVRRLSEEFEVEPAPETQSVARALRLNQTASAGLAARVPASGDREPVATVSAAGDQRPEHAAPPTRIPASLRGRRAIAVAALLVVAVSIGAYVVRGVQPRSASAPSLTVSTAAMARRLYDEGMRAFSAGNLEAAERLTRAAVEEDSTFGMAMLQWGHLLGLRGAHAEGQRIQGAALRLAPRQSDHERLRILTLYADHFGDPRLRVYAETLAIRYPADLDGQLLVAKGRAANGDFTGVVEPLRRVIAADTTGGDTPRGCPACEAYQLLTNSYEHRDSLAAAERTAREWVRSRPTDPNAWLTLAYQLAIQERHTEALAAVRRAGDIAPALSSRGAIDEILLRAGDFETLSHVLEVRLASGNRDEEAEARFLHWRLLREQGRFRESLEFTRRHRDMGLVMRAQSLADVGQLSEAVALWDSAAAALHPGPEPATSVAAMRAGYRIRAVDLLAELRDTVGLARQLPLVSADAALSGRERIRRLDQHARGMMLLARGDTVAACPALRRALFSATDGYVGTFLAVGRACLAAGRPTEAIPALRGILRGPVGASGTAGNFTQARELLARAFLAAGNRDSAAAYVRRVSDAWARADMPLRTRAMAAHDELLGAGRR